jgi:ABC-type transport system substrate-binding protein
MAPSRLVNNLVQFRPEFMRTPALGDARVRKAMVSSIDLQTLNDALFEGQSINPFHFGVPGTPSYQEIDRTVTKYPFDPRQTELFMNEAGFTKDREGFFANAAGERFRPDYQVLTGTQFERGGAVLSDTWQRVGIDAQLSVLPAVQVRQNEVRDAFPGISTPGAAGGDERNSLEYFTSRQIGRPENGWVGPNRGAWSNAEYDRLWDAYSVTLDRDERTRVAAQMSKIVSDELPGWALYWDFNVMAYLATITGPSLGVANSTTDLWNIHEWTMQ